jgi:hypothetical protein
MVTRSKVLSPLTAAALLMMPSAGFAQVKDAGKIVSFTEIRSQGFAVVAPLWNRGSYDAQGIGLGVYAFEYDRTSGATNEYRANMTINCYLSDASVNNTSDYIKVSGGFVERSMTSSEIQKYFPQSIVYRYRDSFCNGNSISVL